MVFFWKKKKEEKTSSGDEQNLSNQQNQNTDDSNESLSEQEMSEDAKNDIINKLGLVEEPSEISSDDIDVSLEHIQEDEDRTDIDEEEVKPTEKKGFFQRLKDRLVKTKESVFNKVKKLIRLKGKIDEELLEEIEEILIQADVGVETTLKIIDAMRNNESIKEKKEPEALIEEFKKAILQIIRKDERPITLVPTPPTIILVVGVNGTGKTTTIGKLAKHFADNGKKVMLVAGDTFRAAAIEQLEIWAKRTKSEFVAQKMGADPGSVCFDALHAAKNKNIDVVLIDTAGRLHTKVNLMEELKKVVRVIKKVMPEAPHETLLVLDATTGQNAVSQAKIFMEAVSITGLIMTKLDGTAKGGILIAIRDQFKVPVVKIGIGEQVNDLRDFNPEEFVDALFSE